MTKTRMQNLTTPRKLLSRMPHLRDSECRRQQKVLAATAMAMTLPGVAWALAASRMFWAKAIEFGAVFSRTMKVMPKRQVARNMGFLRK